MSGDSSTSDSRLFRADVTESESLFREILVEDKGLRPQATEGEEHTDDDLTPRSNASLCGSGLGTGCNEDCDACGDKEA